MTRTSAAVVLTALALVLLPALGGAAVVLGEGDDSPGLQLLGVLLVLGTAAAVTRRLRARDRD